MPKPGRQLNPGKGIAKYFARVGTGMEAREGFHNSSAGTHAMELLRDLRDFAASLSTPGRGRRIRHWRVVGRSEDFGIRILRQSPRLFLAAVIPYPNKTFPPAGQSCAEHSPLRGSVEWQFRLRASGTPLR